ncbi:Alpha-mannosidase [Pediococcus damnosus]|uniref:alpha-mannosidase n=1 Tax=Pediococcus damnosus TaxID=51663 RepID=UPI00078C73E8|nr:alpha-mannosidase [Pediococcus damnosus]AMV70150.1 Alpha-mannosidase [Pediococcus damnosus]
MKRVYIVPHSHWDREWYMPFEQHHMRLIELIDNLIKLFKTDPEYKYFHLDGQTIILDDYLQVRPENREIIQNLINQGKLQIGPFYILQDAFLTSSESNARDMLIGHRDSKSWGKHMVHVGYFPDTFGNMGQAPQMLKQVGLDTAMFGRGVKPTGFSNSTSPEDNFSTEFSEMKWVGPDNSSVLGILFANWYDNGKEIPTDPIKAKAFWDKKLTDAEKSASTDDLLFLNGSDHEPVQMDLSKAIRTANELYPDIEFIHGNYDMYIEQLKKDLPKKIDEIDGELTSQETNGWTTLANTASNRIYLKQWNTKVSKQLENIAEPLATIASQKTDFEYPHDQLRYAWKWLMQNHPHDSICACSVDDVADEMITRFKKSNQVGKFVADAALNKIKGQLNTNKIPHNLGEIPFTVFNTGTSNKTGTVIAEIPIKKIKFNPNKDSSEKIYQALKNENTPKYTVYDDQNKTIPAEVLDSKVKFNFDLPKDKFRRAYIEKVIHVKILMENMKPVSWKTFKLVPLNIDSKVLQKNSMIHDGILENEFLAIKFSKNGTLSVTDKQTGHLFKDQLCYEDTGDLGNEYVYRAPKNSRPIFSSDFPNKIVIKENNSFVGKVEIKVKMRIPVSMNKKLKEEQEEHLDYRLRTAQRSGRFTDFTIQTEVTLEKGSRRIGIRTSFDNNSMDHRVRALFSTGLQTKEHYADSIFEVVKRPNSVSDKWKNPENPQHTHSFVNVHDKKVGVTISNFGLNEYEVDNTGKQIAITLLRSIGEMGDWGYFPTPGAQCLGQSVVDLGIAFHGSNEESRLQTFHDAFAAQVPFTIIKDEWNDGKIETSGCFVNVPSKEIKITAIKLQEDGNNVITRQYNLTNHESHKGFVIGGYVPYKSNILEKQFDRETANLKLQPYEIHTSVWRKK